MQADLNKIAEMVEQADGPSRELDAEIALALSTPNWRRLKPWKRTNGWAKPDCAVDAWAVLNYDSGGEPYPTPDYTASLDAAMTLVPEGWTFVVANCSAVLDVAGPVSGGGSAYVCREVGEANGNPVTAATPALALVAAALRARASNREG